MDIFAFIGSSGSGKSQRALNVANDLNTEFIIDDGLLIKGTKVICGYSAKKESTKIGAIKRALFMDTEHAMGVKTAIEEFEPCSMLILGTSEGMIERITENLELPNISKKIYIEDIATLEEIHYAKKIRKEQGKHVIPVPTFEIKKDFSGYFIDPLRIFRRKSNEENLIQVNEKTVVRPTYSYMGKYYINDTVVNSIVELSVLSIEGIEGVKRVITENNNGGIVISIEVAVKYGFSIVNMLTKAQKKTTNDVEHMSGLNVIKVNITARSIVI